MALDLKEDKMVKEFIRKKKEGTDTEDEKYFNKLKVQKKMSQNQIDKEFDELDVTKFNPVDGKSK